MRRGVLVVRHGERVDQVFGKSWLQQCSTADGRYYRPDLNFPPSLPRRSNGIKDFENDPPLSACGVFQSRLAGEALMESGIRVTAVFTSPALRCVQTAKHILEELKLEKKLKIKVEPGLFEWVQWEASKAAPSFLTLEELEEANFNVDPCYRVTITWQTELLHSSLVLMLGTQQPSASMEHTRSPCRAGASTDCEPMSPTDGPSGPSWSSSAGTYSWLPPQGGSHVSLYPPFRPAFPRHSLLPAESYGQYVDRCALSVGQIVSTSPQDLGITLIVSHGSALDSCTRPLLGLPPRECGDFAQLVRKIPSLGMCFCEENKEEGKWELVNPPVRTLTHGANAAFNWRNWISGN